MLVAVCYLSKYVVARPLKTKTTAEVVAMLLSIYLTFGIANMIREKNLRARFVIQFYTFYSNFLDMSAFAATHSEFDTKVRFETFPLQN